MQILILLTLFLVCQIVLWFHWLSVVWHVDPLLLLSLDFFNPIFGVVFRVDLELFQAGGKIGNRNEERDHNEIHEAWLGGADRRRGSVTEERNRQACLLLLVTLVEEFFEEQPCPLNCDVEGTNLGRNICSVH